MIYAELADGRKLEFPDGTDPTVIQNTVKKITATPKVPAQLEQKPRVGLNEPAPDYYTESEKKIHEAARQDYLERTPKIEQAASFASEKIASPEARSGERRVG